jgi:acetolactate synthase-1/2/3 large subunit
MQAIADATGAEFVNMPDNASIEAAIQKADELAAQGRPVIVDVNIDYSKRTRFTQGVVKANLGRFPLSEKARFILRALKRKITG